MSLNGFLPGKHILLDLYGASNLTNLQHIEKTLRTAAESAGATVLKTDLHTFGEGLGITGVAILAESHISIHTWPEHHYAAIDIFMCGTSSPERAIPILEAFFQPARTETSIHSRGHNMLPAKGTACDITKTPDVTQL